MLRKAGIEILAFFPDEFLLENNEIIQTKYFKKSEGKTFPPSEFPSEEKKFKGFIWREDEQPKTVEDIFIKNTNTVVPNVKKNNSAIKKAEKLFIKETTKKQGLKKSAKVKPLLKLKSLK